MEDLLLKQLEARNQRRPYAVATIVEATGSTPRTEGKMLVFADGSSIGTIGGGIAELRAKKDAVEAIRSGKMHWCAMRSCRRAHRPEWSAAVLCRFFSRSGT